VLGELLIRGVEIGFVAQCPSHAALQVVRYHGVGHAAEVRQRADVGAQPVGRGLRPASLRVGVVRATEHGDEDLRFAYLARPAIDDRDGVARVVDEEFIAGCVHGPEHELLRRAPAPIAIAERRVLQSLRVPRSVLLPQQQPCDTAAAELGVHGGVVG
jgi:hypothetical protein